MRFCPYCSLNVVPKDDGLCPSCRRNLDAPVQLAEVDLFVKRGDQLPKICCQCGGATERIIEVGDKPDMFHGSFLSWFRYIVQGAALLHPKLLLNWLVDHRSTFYVPLPQCKRCAGYRVPLPTAVDYSAKSICCKFSDEFKRRFRAENTQDRENQVPDA